MGSETGKGWRVAIHMAAHHDVWVLTRANNQPAIEAAMRSNPIEGLHFIYYDLPKWARFWKRGQWGTQLYYYLWQFGVYRHIRRTYKALRPDLVHHYTFAKYWTPSFLSLLPIPFVWGPVGGGESTPKALLSYFGLRGQFEERLRDIARWVGEQDPFVRLTARHSALAYATTQATKARIQPLGARNIQVRPAIALDAKDIARLGDLPSPGNSPVRFVFVGRLLGWKGAGLAIMALAKAGVADAELWIVGGGPDESNLRHVAKNEDVAESVKFWGELSREDAFGKLGQCHVLVHPSLHDSGGWVCLEAMAARRPVICLDLGGPGAIVSNAAGIKVPAHSEDQIVRDIAAAMRNLAVDRSLRATMGEAGRQEVLTHFSWPEKCREISETYFQVLSRGTSMEG
jgi:glycosyltransferase involved in cell wall biosynthesis